MLFGRYGCEKTSSAPANDCSPSGGNTQFRNSHAYGHELVSLTVADVACSPLNGADGFVRLLARERAYSLPAIPLTVFREAKSQINRRFPRRDAGLSHNGTERRAKENKALTLQGVFRAISRHRTGRTARPKARQAPSDSIRDHSGTAPARCGQSGQAG